MEFFLLRHVRIEVLLNKLLRSVSIRPRDLDIDLQIIGELGGHAPSQLLNSSEISCNHFLISGSLGFTESTVIIYNHRRFGQIFERYLVLFVSAIVIAPATQNVTQTKFLISVA